MTYGDTVAACEARGLVLCHQSCFDLGCQYNKHPVYSGLPCPSAGASPPPSLPAPPSLPPAEPIPQDGIAIVAGDREEVETLFCLWPGDEAVTSSVGQEPSREMRRTDIAAQCCASVQPDPVDCRRLALDDGAPSTDEDDCIAGKWRRTGSTFVAMTYGETVAACDARGLVLCHQSCYDLGCQYNQHPVYSGMPCPVAPPASPPPPSIPQEGIAILAGDRLVVETLFCLWPGDEAVTSSVGREPSREMRRTDIAAQCCASVQPVPDDC